MVFQSVCAILHFCQQWIRVPVFPQPCQHLLLSRFWISSIFFSEKIHLFILYERRNYDMGVGREQVRKIMRVRERESTRYLSYASSRPRQPQWWRLVQVEVMNSIHVFQCGQWSAKQFSQLPSLSWQICKSWTRSRGIGTWKNAYIKCCHCRGHLTPLCHNPNPNFYI